MINDILNNESCELIAAEAVKQGFKDEWELTLRFEGAVFPVKAFAEHARLLKAVGLHLPERWQAKQDYAAPYTVVIESDEHHGNQRRITGAYNQMGELLKIADYKYVNPKAEVAALRDENAALKAELERYKALLASIAVLAQVDTPKVAAVNERMGEILSRAS